MGVQNLWKLLSPVGRRINVESLARKTLAVDVSIWLVQFIKAMRDEEGKTTRHAHLIGTFRRIARLLFHRIRPVFVFDGGAPVLKKRTVELRRQRRAQQDLTLRQRAQAILVAQLKLQLDAARQVELTKGHGAASTTKGYAPGFNPGTQVGTLATSPSTADREIIAIADDGSDDDHDEDDDVEWEDGDIRKVVGAQSDEEGDAHAHWDVGSGTLGTGGDIDPESLQAMPVTMRKGIIEAVHRDYRKRSRDALLHVAGDMGAYSAAQVTSFLRVSRFNKKVCVPCSRAASLCV